MNPSANASASGNAQAKERRRRRIRALSVVAGILLVLFLIFVIGRPKAVPADFGEAVRGPMRVTLDEEGETRVRDRYRVSAPLAGRVLRIELEPGDAVVAGETVLATFQPSEPGLLDARSLAEAEGRVRAAESSLGLARAERDRAEAQLRFAEAELDRQRTLAEEEIVSRERLDSAELAADTQREAKRAADFAVRTARHDLEVAKARLVQGRRGAGGGATSTAPITITSPVDGVVLRRLRESETVVPAGEALLEVADPARLEIVSDFLSTDAVRIEPGLEVLIEQWGGDRSLHGEVRRVEPSGFTKVSALGVEEQRVNVIIDFDDPRDAWSRLGDGFRVEVRVVVWQEDEVLKIPTSALFRDTEGAWAVYRVEGGVASITSVEVGRRNGLEAQVLSGLGEGDRVVVHPSDDVVDGSPVAAR
ncbi:MAG: HlyD family efflux transporter periplasmic adaptor subunit [Acidobacteriota bacterium]